MRLLTISFLRLLSAAAVIVATLVIGAHDAHANARVCSSLKDQLAGLSSGGGNATKYNRYNSALTKQTRELKKAQNMARRGGCNRSNSSQCSQLNAAIPKMKANASKLRKTRDRYAGKSSSGQVRQLRAKLKANRCDRQVLFPSKSKGATASIRKASTNKKTIVGKSPSNKSTGKRGASVINPPAPLAPQSLTSGVRTMCVRTCDGYYFPVSFGADTSQVKRDANACAAMCPGTETKLYMHKVPEEETEAMISVTGERYVDSETAFAYLKPGHLDNRDASCSCRAQQAINNKQSPVPPGLLQTALTDTTLADMSAKTALPALRPDLHADPDTQATIHGDFTLEIMATMLNSLGLNDPVALVRNDAVRVVLPEFLPAPTTATGLQVPGPTRVQ